MGINALYLAAVREQKQWLPGPLVGPPNWMCQAGHCLSENYQKKQEHNETKQCHLVAKEVNSVQQRSINLILWDFKGFQDYWVYMLSKCVGWYGVCFCFYMLYLIVQYRFLWGENNKLNWIGWRPKIQNLVVWELSGLLLFKNQNANGFQNVCIFSLS